LHPDAFASSLEPSSNRGSPGICGEPTSQSPCCWGLAISRVAVSASWLDVAGQCRGHFTALRAVALFSICRGSYGPRAAPTQPGIDQRIGFAASLPCRAPALAAPPWISWAAVRLTFLDHERDGGALRASLDATLRCGIALCTDRFERCDTVSLPWPEPDQFSLRSAQSHFYIAQRFTPNPWATNFSSSALAWRPSTLFPQRIARRLGYPASPHNKGDWDEP